MNYEKSDLQIFKISDEEIFEEAAKRLKLQYAKEHGLEFKYGCFHFVFHDGRFQGVEDWPRNKRYISSNKGKIIQK